jgi:hypothetical protein
VKKMSAMQTDIFNQFTANYPSKTIAKWEAMVAAWNTNPKVLNLYQELLDSKFYPFSFSCCVTHLSASNKSTGCSAGTNKERSCPGCSWPASSSQS